MNALGLLFVLFFASLMVAFWYLNRRANLLGLRRISAFSRLRQAIDLSVEDGSRLHVTLGRGGLTGPQSAAALVGLSMLKRVSQIASESDRPPIATTGEGVLALLAQDTLRATYEDRGVFQDYDPTSGRLAGLTPFSYAAATLPIMRDEAVSANLLAGNFGAEVGLITTGADYARTLSLGGADNLTAQSILYATAQEPLVGEELYAGGAYLDAGPMHSASLHAQDVIRWLLVIFILFNALRQLIAVF